jgi:hypothetical protein
MIALLLAAYLTASQTLAAAAKAAAQPPAPADVWLDCKWHETWKTSGTLGSSHREDTTEHDYNRIYMFSAKNGTLYLYQNQTLFHQDAEIGTTAIMIDDQEHSESLGYQTKSRHQWVVSRQDLSVKVFGSSLTNFQMDDGRISTTLILMTGDGACVMTGPQPLTPVAPNVF